MTTLVIAESGPLTTGFIVGLILVPVLVCLAVLSWKIAPSEDEDDVGHVIFVLSAILLVPAVGMLISTIRPFDTRYHQERAVTGVVEKVDVEYDERRVFTMDGVMFAMDHHVDVKTIKVGDKVQLRCVEQATGYYEGAYKCTLEGKS